MIRKIIQEIPTMVEQMGYYEAVKFLLSLTWSKAARNIVMMEVN